ncbi:MAG: hypothetical protein KDC87_17785 [Planctomycetes bacterium]|nr:hypothetical protein [Planctomycetota bacterium]
MSESWKILRDRGRCERAGCPLASETEYFAVLELPSCVRIERCGRCFDEIRRARSEPPFHWLVKRTKGGKKEPSLDLESLRSLFDRLGEPLDDDGADAPVDAVAEAEAEAAVAATEEEVAALAEHRQRTAAGLRYLVALLLLRKRRLKLVDPTTPEEEAADLLVVDPRIEGMAPVSLFAPELGDDGLDGLRDELMAAVGH